MIAGKHTTLGGDHGDRGIGAGEVARAAAGEAAGSPRFCDLARTREPPKTSPAQPDGTLGRSGDRYHRSRDRAGPARDVGDVPTRGCLMTLPAAETKDAVLADV